MVDPRLWEIVYPVFSQEFAKMLNNEDLWTDDFYDQIYSRVIEAVYDNFAPGDRPSNEEIAAAVSLSIDLAGKGRNPGLDSPYRLPYNPADMVYPEIPEGLSEQIPGWSDETSHPNYPFDPRHPGWMRWNKVAMEWKDYERIADEYLQIGLHHGTDLGVIFNQIVSVMTGVYHIDEQDAEGIARFAIERVMSPLEQNEDLIYGEGNPEQMGQPRMPQMPNFQEQFPGISISPMYGKEAEVLNPILPDLNYVLDYNNPDNIEEDAWQSAILHPNWVQKINGHEPPKPKISPQGTWEQARNWLYEAWNNNDWFVKELERAIPDQPFEFVWDDRFPYIADFIRSFPNLKQLWPTIAVIDRVGQGRFARRQSGDYYMDEFQKRDDDSWIRNNVWLTCPFCGSDNTTESRLPASWKIWKKTPNSFLQHCRNCGQYFDQDSDTTDLIVPEEFKRQSDYFYDWNRFTPDDGSLEDDKPLTEAGPPAFMGIPNRCPTCGDSDPGHMVNLDEYDQSEPDRRCPDCGKPYKDNGYAYPMEYDEIQRTKTPWHVLNKEADVNGYSNWDTWHTVALIDNTRDLQEKALDIIRNGGTIENLRDWAIKAVLGPYNKEKFNEANEWNSKSTEERYQIGLDQGKQDWEMYEFVQNYTPEQMFLMEEHLINWQQIYDSFKSFLDERYTAKVSALTPQEQAVVTAIYRDPELFHYLMEIYNGVMFGQSDPHGWGDMHQPNYDFYVNSVREAFLEWYPQFEQQPINWGKVFEEIRGLAGDYYQKMDFSPSNLTLPPGFSKTAVGWRAFDPNEPTDVSKEWIVRELQKEKEQRLLQEQQREPIQFNIPDKAIQQSLYKHRCINCGGYLRQQGEFYQCENCPWHWPQDKTGGRFDKSPEHYQYSFDTNPLPGSWWEVQWTTGPKLLKVVGRPNDDTLLYRYEDSIMETSYPIEKWIEAINIGHIRPVKLSGRFDQEPEQQMSIPTNPIWDEDKEKWEYFLGVGDPVYAIDQAYSQRAGVIIDKGPQGYLVEWDEGQGINNSKEWMPEGTLWPDTEWKGYYYKHPEINVLWEHARPKQAGEDDPYANDTVYFTDQNDPQERDMAWNNSGPPAFINKPENKDPLMQKFILRGGQPLVSDPSRHSELSHLDLLKGSMEADPEDIDDINEGFLAHEDMRWLDHDLKKGDLFFYRNPSKAHIEAARSLFPNIKEIRWPGYTKRDTIVDHYRY